ncbi:MAG: class I mannose-6-phosphate isomerase [Candidatus Aureabacteria bacterium]|nr:class I mannose-6-phosphate isomerase [Candidatus Auribacterota bacterium]
MKLYPLRFEPIYKEKVWGGDKLNTLYDRRIPPGRRMGESWEIADHGDDISRVAHGPLKGRSLRELMEQYPRELLGGAPAGPLGRFPLLVKFIDAAENLSVQVHPDDAYAAVHEGGAAGKTELWYVAGADPGAGLICGCRGEMEKEAFTRAIDGGNVLEFLRHVPVKEGDAVFVPAGCVHSIGAGTLILEIGTSSDITYRVYDWGRTGRELHRGKALEVSILEDGARYVVAKRWDAHGGFKTALLAECPSFRSTEVRIATGWGPVGRRERFDIVSVTAGEGLLECGGGVEPLELFPGDTILIPASLGGYTLKAVRGDCTIVHTEVP